MKNFIVGDEVETDGSSLVSCMNKTFKEICDVFGEPNCDGDGYKTDAEWCIQFTDGTIATIYNWKDGKNYCGNDGLEVKHITDWHIGGFNNKASINVLKAFKK